MKNMTRITALSLLLGSMSPLPLMAEDVLVTDADLASKGAYTTYTNSSSVSTRVSVHDPSVFVDTITSKTVTSYWIVGSHLGFANTLSTSSPFERWNAKGAGDGGTPGMTFATPSGATCTYKNAYGTQQVSRVKNYQGVEVDFPNFDAHAWQFEGSNVQGNQWAPDVVWNPVMKKWLMYMSLNGDHWGSSIVCFASSKASGPYVYQGPVVMSGFQGTYAHNGFAAAADWKHTDLAIATGVTSLPARYAVSDKWGTYWPNCIDPCVFYDEEGKLWMSYGSWSGGIWMLQLDPNTGLRDYTVQYPYQVNNTDMTPGSANANCTSDPYFGRKIAGGWYVSGEGSYIEHFGDYYYLFLSYGFFAPDGGYEMRIFRSDKPDGPYKDCYGTSAVQTGKYEMNYGTNATTNRGMKLMGSYKWDLMPTAEVAQGHNSAVTDREGRMLVVYHTKFGDFNPSNPNAIAFHSVRTHQLYLNQDGWLVSAPYEFHGEKTTQANIASQESIPDESIPGSYQFIVHKYNQNYAGMAYQKPIVMQLAASASDPKQGTVSGTYPGKWKRIAGTDFIEITLHSSVVYKGVLTRQTVDYSNIPAICISAVSSGSGNITLGENNFTYQRQIWGSKSDTYKSINYTKKKLTTIPFKEGETTAISANVSLPTTGYLGCTVAWTSSDTKILTNAGVKRGDGYVTMTLSIKKDGCVYQKAYQLAVGDVSAITAVSADQDVEAAEGAQIYNLLGQPVDRMAGAGLYIVNGKKIIRK